MSLGVPYIINQGQTSTDATSDLSPPSGSDAPTTTGDLLIRFQSWSKATSPDEPNSNTGTNCYSGTWAGVGGGSRGYNTAASPIKRVRPYWSPGQSTTAGVHTLGFAATETGFARHMIGMSGANTTSPIVAGNTLTPSNDSSVTTLSFVIPNTVGAGNRYFLVVSTNGVSSAPVAPSGFTNLGVVQQVSTPTITQFIMYSNLGLASGTYAPTWTGSAVCGGFGFEIAASGVAGHGLVNGGILTTLLNGGLVHV